MSQNTVTTINLVFNIFNTYMGNKNIENMTIGSIEQMRTVNVRFEITTKNVCTKTKIKEFFHGFIKISEEYKDRLITLNKLGESYENKYEVEVNGYICCQKQHEKNEIISYGKDKIRKSIRHKKGIKLNGGINYKVLNKYNVDDFSSQEIFSKLSE